MTPSVESATVQPSGNGAGECAECGHPLVPVPGRHPVCTNAPAHARLPAPTVDCRDYRAHQSYHRRVAGGWVCDACEATP